MANIIIDPSPSRTYVAICKKTNGKGFYCRKFILPANYQNSHQTASWWFLNRLDGAAYLELLITWEDYNWLDIVQ